MDVYDTETSQPPGDQSLNDVTRHQCHDYENVAAVVAAAADDDADDADAADEQC